MSWPVDLWPLIPEIPQVENSPLKTFGANVRELRKALGYTQESFAQHALLDRAFYGLIERGKQNVSLRTVCALSASLGVGPAELFAGIDSQQCAEWLAGEGG